MNKKKEKKNAYINQHSDYVDYRIKQISDYVSSNDCHSDLNKIISLTIKFLIDKINQIHISQIYDEYTYDLLLELKILVGKWDILKDGDIIGYVYQEIQSKVHKKNKGQYFTPSDIVKYVVSHTLNKDDSVLDPACGSGQFLIEVFRQLIVLHNINLNTSSTSGYSEYIKTILSKLIGFDIDPLAVAITKWNLSRISGISESDINIFHFDFLERDSLKQQFNNIEPGSFDLLIGNPPWGSKLSLMQKKYYRDVYETAQSGINTFTLFIERAFDFIHASGVIAFLIPEAYLNIKAHKDSRKFILDRTCIIDIALWGDRFKDVYAPSITLIVRQEEQVHIRKSHIAQVKPEKQLNDGTSVLIPQESFKKQYEHIINIKYSRIAVNIIDSIERQDCITLKDRAQFFLGIVTGNNNKFLSKIQSEEYPDPIIIGKDIRQYQIDFSHHYFNSSVKLQQVAPLQYYQTKHKILYKFIGKNLTFVLDKKGYYMLNNVNGLILDSDEISREVLISILNSKLMQYYYENNFFTVKVLRGNLERLPIIKMKKENQKKVSQFTQDIMESRGERYFKLKDNIEDVILHEYGIKDRTAHKIFEK